MSWIVTLTKPCVVNDFRSDFFPRKLHYKKDAIELVKEVQSKGGDATVTKKPSFRTKMNEVINEEFKRGKRETS